DQGDPLQPAGAAARVLAGGPGHQQRGRGRRAAARCLRRALAPLQLLQLLRPGRHRPVAVPLRGRRGAGAGRGGGVPGGPPGAAVGGAALRGGHGEAAGDAAARQEPAVARRGHGQRVRPARATRARPRRAPSAADARQEEDVQPVLRRDLCLPGADEGAVRPHAEADGGGRGARQALPGGGPRGGAAARALAGLPGRPAAARPRPREVPRRAARGVRARDAAPAVPHGEGEAHGGGAHARARGRPRLPRGLQLPRARRPRPPHLRRLPRHGTPGRLRARQAAGQVRAGLVHVRPRQGAGPLEPGHRVAHGAGAAVARALGVIARRPPAPATAGFI
ncbi:Protein of unknown function, partial [Gryllus bimaculatus]